MGRPSLDLGTAGTIRIYGTPTGYRAMTRYRDWDGSVRSIERHGATKGAATQSLKLALRDRARIEGGADITAETRLNVLAETWYSSLDLSPGTMQAYRYGLDRLILPALGRVRIREISVGLLDRHLTTIKTKHGSALAKQTRSVLSGVCGLACRLDLMESNPCRDTSRISTKPKHPPEAMSLERTRQLLAYLSYDQQAIDRDLPDFVAFMLGTGLRIGETAALTWDCVDLDASTVEVRGTVLRLKGKGLVIKPSPKSRAGERILELPSWGSTLLQRRRTSLNSHDDAPTTPIFPAPLGGLRDPSNTNADLCQTFAFAGEPSLTSHSLRKTVATLMDEAGLSARQAADQLGHAHIGMTQNVYFGRKRRATGAAVVLEQLGA